MLLSKDDLRTLPVFAPLLAAVIAPLCTLIDIPALTEKWFTTNEATLPDPSANLALSAVQLAFSFLANGLLIIRFSLSGNWWRKATTISMACWVVKFIISLVNVLTFGFLARNKPGITYDEGFWCALMSLIMTAVIVALLLWHYMARFVKDKGKTRQAVEVRIAGRHFMLQTTLFICTIGILALFMSRLEHWSYAQGIYFAVVSFLTVGFGDFYPTKVPTQIVLFPFLVIGIVQLASLIGMLVRYFSKRITEQHSKRRVKAAKLRQKEMEQLTEEPDLERELQFLIGLYRSTNDMQRLKNLFYAGFGFLVFWVIGALIFSRIESWTYGQGLYFNYVFFLAVGYGDYAPITPAGRVVFIVYSLLAVPIITSFAVETIQEVTKDISYRLLERRKAKHGVSLKLNPGSKRLGDPVDEETRPDEPQSQPSEGSVTIQDNGDDMAEEKNNNVKKDQELPQDVEEQLSSSSNEGVAGWDRPHTQYVVRAHEHIDHLLQTSSSSTDPARSQSKSKEDGSQKGNTDGGSEDIQEAETQLAERDADRILTEYVLELAVELEQHARRLLLAFIDEGSDFHILLKADRIVQLQNIRTLARREQKVDNTAGEGKDNTNTNQPRNGEKSEKETDEKDGNEVDGLASGKTGDRPKINALMQKYYEEESELTFPSDLDERETIDEIMRYREAFAGLLAAGSRLMRLKEDEQLMFERRIQKGKGRSKTSE